MPKKIKMKILFFDIETAPNLAYVWGKWEQDVIEFDKEWYILSFSAKWLDGKATTKCLADYPLYKRQKENDRDLVRDLWEYFNDADVIIGHNCSEFDIKKTNTKFIEHGLLPPANYQTIDTLKVAQKHFGFNSNKLDDLGKKLKVGRKVKHHGFETWLGCMQGKRESWREIKKYNRGDTLLLEKIYLKLRPWISTHPNISLEGKCPSCGEGKLQKRGFGATRTGKYPRFQCQNCGSWSRGRHTQMTTIR